MADRPPLPSSFDDNLEYQETGYQKIVRKLREEPLIPLGTGLTCLALYNAWRAMRRGDHVGVQRMFRARIAAQAFTVLSMVAGGAYYGADREKRKELIKLEAQRRAEERNQKWLHELEVRDEEDRKLQAAVQRKRERLEQRRADERQKKKKEAEDGEEGDGTAKDGAAKEPRAATASATPAVTAVDTAKKPEEKTGAGSSGVMGALSEAGGWFGTKKGSAEQSKPDAETPKK
ncbi:mitochondrial hypoxia responsive domain-containing protein [Xylaria palmicola]|nr:mitochondrial hypoxia responsive domain-containing protein [Xylaria palmicola]